jgi:hypothetical protein
MSEIPYTPFKKLNLTYKRENYPSHTSLSQPRIDYAIAEAFAKWQAVSPFTFSPYMSGEPDIKLSFSTVTKPNENHAETRWDTRTTVFSDRCNWVEIADPFDVHKVDVLSVAVHEIGHVLGLLDSSDPSSVMTAGDYNKLRAVSRSPIPQVDIDKLKLVYPSEFSQYYASQGKITWWEPPGTSNDYKFIHVSAGIDNTVWAIDIVKRVALEFGPLDDYSNAWANRGLGLMRLTVFNENLVFGTSVHPDPLQPQYDKTGRPPFFYLKRYDRQTQSWNNVSTGSLDGRYGFGTKLGLVAVGPGGSVWAIAAPPQWTQQIVRYEGDIIAGTGDWKVVPAPPGLEMGPAPLRRFLDLAVGRRNGEPWIWVAHAATNVFEPTGGDAMEPPIDFFASNDQGKTWDTVQRIPPGVLSGPTVRHPSTYWVSPGIAPPAMTEAERYRTVCKCVSVGDDGTAVRVFKDSAYRFDGSTWTRLPGQFFDVSVISRTNMWAADFSRGIRSTIVTDRG